MLEDLGHDLSCCRPRKAGTHNLRLFRYYEALATSLLLRRMGPRLRGDDSGRGFGDDSKG